MSQGVGVVIVGGGIAGLSAAYDLAKAGAPYTLIEKLPRLGGVIQTTARDGCIIEGGPDSFISQKPEALALIKELGLEQEVIGSNDATRVTYILRRGRLVRLPEGIRMIVPTRVWPLLEVTAAGMGNQAAHGPGAVPQARVRIPTAPSPILSSTTSDRRRSTIWPSLCSPACTVAIPAR